MKLSVLMPVYNETATIQQILEKVIAACAKMDHEIIVLDDGSADDTVTKVKAYVQRYCQIRLWQNPTNRGKGYCLRRGIKMASGDFILIQDSDLEYDPGDYPRLLAPILEDKADVVFGSRFITGAPRRVLHFWHYLGNKFLTFCSNMFTNLNLSDMETCYKVFRADMAKSLNLQEERFGFEPEITYKLSRIDGLRIYEVGISYHGRTYSEGKKIGWKDGLRAIWVILKYPLLHLLLGKKAVFSKAASSVVNGPEENRL